MPESNLSIWLGEKKNHLYSTKLIQPLKIYVKKRREKKQSDHWTIELGNSYCLIWTITENIQLLKCIHRKPILCYITASITSL